MRKIFIILNEPEEKFLYKIFFYFRNFDFKIININVLNKYTEKRDLIVFNKNYHPLKNKLNEINSIKDKFCYLSSDKNIYLI